MKVNGKPLDLSQATYGPLVIQRGNNPDGTPNLIGFYARPLLDYKEFDSKVVRPTPTQTTFTKDGKKPDFTDPQYLQEMGDFNRKRWGYLVLKTLEPSGVEIDGISLEDPDSWGKVEDAFKANLGQYEFAELMRLVDEANCLDAEKLEVNRQTFLSLSGDLASPPVTKSSGVAENT